MKITGFSCGGFKNLKDISMTPNERLNILIGENAQGKTNLIEAIWICTGVKSFRSTKDKDMIDLKGERADITLTFEDNARTQTIKYSVMRQDIKNKLITLNGVKLPLPSRLFGNLRCVVFTPEDLSLSKGSPDNRRQFLDLSISQIKGRYASVVQRYNNILEQRNTLLKTIAFGRAQADDLDVWDIQLAKLGSYISMMRYNYSKKLGQVCAGLFDDISKGRENLSLYYQSTVFNELEERTDYSGGLADEYLQRLSVSRNEDIRLGFTTKGVHRDDLCGIINGVPLREFASQGQHRSAALVMKLSQAYILTEETDDPPVILLDDVMSELDRSRQEFVINKIRGMQVFITCCDMNELISSADGAIYNIENGRVGLRDASPPRK
ncbi:MAG: DNA replication/repair protein RecF [Ruminococcus sp.]|nr:DNA replication/repair protein RecF [Ruminococcus sp.]